MHDIKKNIPGTDEHAMHNPTRGTGGDGVKNAVKVCLDLQLLAFACQQRLLYSSFAHSSFAQASLTTLRSAHLTL